MEGLIGMFGAGVIVAVIVFLVTLAILTFLMPFIIYAIMQLRKDSKSNGPSPERKRMKSKEIIEKELDYLKLQYRQALEQGAIKNAESFNRDIRLLDWVMGDDNGDS